MKNKKFFLGLITGILSTFSVALIAVFIFLVIYGDNLTTGMMSIGDKKLTGSIKESEDVIFDKLVALTDCIDQRSLYNIDDKKAIEGLYKGLFQSIGDDYAAYYTADEYKSFAETTEGEYCGIGALVTTDKDTKAVMIESTFDKSPAQEAGLKKNDIIRQVDDHIVKDEDSETIVSWIKGKEGTKVKVKVEREGEPDYIEFELERKKIEVPTVNYTLKEDNIAYLEVAGFDAVTTEQFKDAIKKAEKDKAKGMLIDLRNNPGGSLNVVVDMLDMFIKKDDLIVYTENKKGERDGEERAKHDVSVKMPLVVLINENSASASEIFAGAIQDYKLGTLVGEKSFGKGIVQVLMPLKDGSAIKFTTSKYFTPKGRYIHKKGISPDVEVKLDVEAYKKDKTDTQYNKAIEELKKLIK